LKTVDEKMGVCLKLIISAHLLAVALFGALLWAVLTDRFPPLPENVPEIEDVWFGHGVRPNKEDTAIKPFKIKISDPEVQDFKAKLECGVKRMQSDPGPIVDSFEYGTNTKYLTNTLAFYWLKSYDWRKAEKRLNSMGDHFKTNIDGLDVHFVHIKPKAATKAKKVLPILMVHGWPGSFVEFSKIAPMMTSSESVGSDFVFELIVPSIPGYGFSSAPKKAGFHLGHCAKVFQKLMNRLGFDKYYTQGGDWGSGITSAMAVMYPDSILGHHTNMPTTGSLSSSIKTWLLPKLALTDQEYKSFQPYTFFHLLRETGYFHLQATRPDTVGVALNTSPLGLAAYIVEKFATFDMGENVAFPDGRLHERFTLDELIDNVMIYWWTGSITSSMRFYKENIGRAVNQPVIQALLSVPIKVPVGIGVGEKELYSQPKSLLTSRYTNMVTYGVLPNVGHFAAYQEPQLLYSSIVEFVSKTEQQFYNNSDNNNNNNSGKNTKPKSEKKKKSEL